jgi:uncharacterized protein (TIGR02118 family)
MKRSALPRRSGHKPQSKGYPLVTISMLYSNKIGSTFDLEYYLNVHMPQSIERLSTHAGYEGVSVARGVGGATPGSEPPFVAICEYRFRSLDDFLAAFNPHAAFLQGDMIKYTDSEPIIQISMVEIVKERFVGDPAMHEGHR